MLLQIIGVQGLQMFGCAFSLTDAVASVGVRHELKLLVVLYQFILQQFGILVVHVVIPSTMDIQQIAPEIFCMGDGRTLHKIFAVFLRQSHVAFLVNIVIGQLEGNRSNGNAGLVDFRIPEHKI